MPLKHTMKLKAAGTADVGLQSWAEVALTHGRIRHVAWSLKGVRGITSIMLGRRRLNMVRLSLSLCCSPGLAALGCRRGFGRGHAQASQRRWQACQQWLHQQRLSAILNRLQRGVQISTECFQDANMTA